MYSKISKLVDLTLVDSKALDCLKDLILDLAFDGNLTNEREKSDWDMGKTLKDFGQIIRGVTYTKSSSSKVPQDEFIPLLGAANIQFEINYSNLTYVPNHLIKTEQLLNDKDILICMSSGSKNLVGKAAMVRNPPRAAFGAFCAIYRPNNLIDSEYISLFFSSPKYRREISASSRGIGINNLRIGDIESIGVPLPPMEKQKVIVRKVSELLDFCSQLEKKRNSAIHFATLTRKSSVDSVSTAQTQEEFNTAWNRIKQNWDVISGTPDAIESLRDLILSLAVSGNLSKDSSPEDSVEELLDEVGKTLNPYPEISDQRFAIPLNWKWVSLASIAEHQLGKMLHMAKMKGVKRLYLRSVNVRPNGTIDLTDLNEMLIPKSELEKYNVKNGDIFVNEGGDVGRNAIFDLEINFDLAFQNQLHRLRPVCGIEGRYIQFVLRQAKSQGVISQMSSGVTIQHFSASALRRFAIPLPPLSEQKLIVERVNNLMRFCDELEHEILQSTRIAEKYARSVVSESA